MAQRTITKLVDDLDKKEIDGDGETIAFTYKGTSFEIDLSHKNAKRLDDALSPFVAAARRVGGRTARRSESADKTQLAAMRQWGKTHGFKVSERGRVSQEVQTAYNTAH